MDLPDRQVSQGSLSLPLSLHYVLQLGSDWPDQDIDRIRPVHLQTNSIDIMLAPS